MRDIAVTAAVFLILPFVFARPYLGILLWTWIGLMNPHKLTWGFAYDFPYAVIIGITTMIAVPVSYTHLTLPTKRIV